MNNKVGLILVLFCISILDVCQAKNGVEIHSSLVDYRVAKNDTLSSLSRTFGISENVLRAVNHLKNDHIRAGMNLQYPKVEITLADASKKGEGERDGGFKDKIVDYRIYTAKSVFYVMVVVDDTDEYRNILLFRKDDHMWIEVDRFTSPYPKHNRSNPQLIITNLDKKGSDECFYFAEYSGSSKDWGVEGICHAPTVEEKSLHGLRVNIHAYSLGAQLTEGYPPQSQLSIEKLGNEKEKGYERYDSYIKKSAKKILGKEYLNSK